MLKLRLKNLAYPLLHGLFLFDEPGSGLSHYIDNRLINLNPNGQNIDTGLIHVSERKARISGSNKSLYFKGLIKVSPTTQVWHGTCRKGI